MTDKERAIAESIIERMDETPAPQQREREWRKANAMGGRLDADGQFYYSESRVDSILAAYRAHVIEEAIAKLPKEREAHCDWEEGYNTAIRHMRGDLHLLRDMKEHV